MSILEIFKWWWENNIEWIRLNDPWLIPFIPIALVSPKIARAIAVFIKIWRGR